MSLLPSVAILIPTYNAGAWLREAVRSALAQEGIVPRVVVCDDGSTDDSLASLGEFAPNLITILRQPKLGGNAARNALLAAADCEWVQYLDADDYLEPHKIARQLTEAGPLDSVDVLYSPVWSESWQDGKAVSRSPSLIDPTLDLFTQWILWQLPQTGGALWRTAALRRIGGWNMQMPCCQEHELYLRALQAGLRWKFCSSPGAVYRLWSESTVCRKDPIQVIRVRTGLIDELIAWLRHNGNVTPAHTDAAAQVGFEMARTWARYDLDAATDYADDRRRQELFRVSGPAAPILYRLVHTLGGFRRAEQIARALR